MALRYVYVVKGIALHAGCPCRAEWPAGAAGQAVTSLVLLKVVIGLPPRAKIKFPRPKNKLRRSCTVYEIAGRRHFE